MWKKKLLLIVLIIVVLISGYILIVSNFHYSEGTRTGYLSKFARKGYVFKTYEGDLYMGGASADNNSLINNQWSFSVPSNTEGVIDSLVKLEGKIVKLHYYQVMKNMPWQGDTEYFIHKAEFVREQ